MYGQEYCDKLRALYIRKNIVRYLTNMLDIVTQRVSFIKGQNIKIADIGAGIGFISSKFREQEINVLNIDINKFSLEYGRKVGWINQCLVGSICELPVKSNSFDMVLLVDVIEHVDNYAVAIRETHRVLKKGGFIVIHTPSKYYSKLLGITWDSTHMHEFSYQELRKALIRNNFDYFFAYGDIPILQNINFKLSSKLSCVLNKKLFYLFPFQGPSFFVIFKKES